MYVFFLEVLILVICFFVLFSKDLRNSFLWLLVASLLVSVWISLMGESMVAMLTAFISLMITFSGILLLMKVGPMEESHHYLKLTGIALFSMVFIFILSLLSGAFTFLQKNGIAGLFEQNSGIQKPLEEGVSLNTQMSALLFQGYYCEMIVLAACFFLLVFGSSYVLSQNKKGEE